MYTSNGGTFRLKGVGAAAAGAVMAAALLLNIHIHSWRRGRGLVSRSQTLSASGRVPLAERAWLRETRRGHESSCEQLYSKLNYGVVDAQTNIPDDWRSSSPTERIQVPQREFGRQTKVKRSFHGSAASLKHWSWLKLAQKPPQKS